MSEPASVDGIRTQDVSPPSSRRETIFIVRAGFLILYLSALLIGLENGGRPVGLGGEPAGVATGSIMDVEPGTIAFRDLDSRKQRVFRQIQEGLTEAEIRRGRTSLWPTPEELAAAGVPPFARDPIDRDGYTWTLLRRGTVLNYAGIPSPSSSEPAFVALILEPDPGTPQDPLALTDEIHHRLSDGTMLHVGVWMRAGLRELKDPVGWEPTGDGWLRIVANGSR